MVIIFYNKFFLLSIQLVEVSTIISRSQKFKTYKATNKASLAFNFSNPEKLYEILPWHIGTALSRRLISILFFKIFPVSKVRFPFLVNAASWFLLKFLGHANSKLKQWKNMPFLALLNFSCPFLLYFHTLFHNQNPIVL